MPFSERGLPAREDRLEVARQCRLEGLLALPLRVLRCQRLDPIEGESELKIKGLFGPQRTVVVEGSDSFFGCDIVRATRFRNLRDEIHNRLLRRAIAPGNQGIMGRDAGALRWCHSSLPSQYRVR